MVTLAVGSIVVPFPFSDLSQSKLRPAVVLADAGRSGPCQISQDQAAPVLQKGPLNLQRLMLDVKDV